MYNVVKCDKNGMTGEMYLSTLRNGRAFHKTNSVTEVTTSLSQLVNGNQMFNAHNKLTKFEQDLPNLTSGISMFASTGLTSFSGNLQNLSDGGSMFENARLGSFNSELPICTNTSGMFRSNKLTKFIVDLPRVTNAGQMFVGCTSLEEFRGCLPSLRTASQMFDRCKLSPLSVMHIIEGIKDVRSEILAENGETALSSSEGIITIGINVTLTEGDDEGNKAILDTFAQETGYKDFNTMNDRFTIDKGWTVTWQSQNSVAIVTPLSMDEPLPIFAKLYECPEEVAEFTDGEKFYTIDYGFAVNGPKAAEYAKFGTLAEALETWNITQYIKEETNV
jgi:hypothetical protein